MTQNKTGAPAPAVQPCPKAKPTPPYFKLRALLCEYAPVLPLVVVVASLAAVVAIGGCTQ